MRNVLVAGVAVVGLVVSLSGQATAQSLELVPVANAGMMLRCGTAAILVDALFREGVKGYEIIAPDRRDAIETGAPPFDGVRIVLATHRHADHFDAGAVARHLAANDRAEFWGTSQTAGPVRARHPARVEEVTTGTRAFDGGDVTFVPVPHNAPHRETIENTALIVRFCGQRVLFSGDAELARADFEPVRRAGVPVDVAVVPWWFLTSRTGQEVVDTVLRPGQLWAVHGDLSDSDAWTAEVRARYPAARIAIPAAPR